MILVDIYVPAVGNVYDFQLDEEEKIGAIVEEIGELIGQKERCQIVGDIGELMLCTRENRQILSKSMTLAASGIQNGYSLILL